MAATRSKAASVTEPQDGDIVAARRQALDRLAGEYSDALLNERVNSRRFDDPRLPMFAPSEDEILEAVRQNEELQQRVTEAAKLNGTTLKDAVGVKRLKDARKEALRENLAKWRKDRKLHQDFVDNPDVYGGVDLGGAPLDPEEQLANVATLDAAIAESEAEIASL